MKTRVLQVDPEHPSASAIADAAGVLRRRGLVAFATETVYGLGALATDPEAVDRIYQAKGRPAHNPLIVHVAEIGQARRCARAWPEVAERLAGSFWPGPVSLVLPRSKWIPDVVTACRDTVALRIPAPPVARALIAGAGLPLAAPSANRSNRLSPTSAEHVLADLEGRIDLILDSGPTALGLESTVLDLTQSPYRILRPGPVGPQEIARCLGDAGLVAPSPGTEPRPGNVAPASPGMMDVHYSPRTPALRVESTEDMARVSWPEQSAVLVLGPTPLPHLPTTVRVTNLPEPNLAAPQLYSVLHQFDSFNLDVIIILMPPDEPAWRTIRDRLIRATKPAGGTPLLRR